MSVKQYDSTNKILKLIAGGTLWADCPIGTINAYGGTTAPDGWLLCEGQALSRTDYADLFAVIGTSFGSGDGNTTFNVPDMRESTFKGTGTNPNGASHVKSGGLAIGEFVDDRIQDFNLNLKVVTGQNGAAVMATDSNAANYPNPIHGLTSDGRIGATTEVKAVGVNFIIKAKQTPLPADLEAAIQDIDFLTWGDNA